MLFAGTPSVFQFEYTSDAFGCCKYMQLHTNTHTQNKNNEHRLHASCAGLMITLISMHVVFCFLSFFRSQRPQAGGEHSIVHRSFGFAKAHRFLNEITIRTRTSRPR